MTTFAKNSVAFLFVVALVALNRTSGTAQSSQASPAAVTLTPTATLDHRPLSEVSGIARSRTYAGTYWVHNDNGHPPALFAVSSTGKVIVPTSLTGKVSVGQTESAGKPFFAGIRLQPGENKDWEDLVLDGRTLYICDVGNNNNNRRDLGVYAVAEPDPKSTTTVRPSAFYKVAYEDQDRFPPTEWYYDCEAAFAHRGKLYFITKHRMFGSPNVPGLSGNLYRMETRDEDRLNVLKKIDSKSDFGGWVTSASLSPNGKTLAVLCHLPIPSIWLFDTPADGSDRFFQSKARRVLIRGGAQSEGICWDDDSTLRLVAENSRGIYVVKVSAFRPVPATASKP